MFRLLVTSDSQFSRIGPRAGDPPGTQAFNESVSLANNDAIVTTINRLIETENVSCPVLGERGTTRQGTTLSHAALRRGRWQNPSACHAGTCLVFVPAGLSALQWVHLAVRPCPASAAAYCTAHRPCHRGRPD